MNFVPSIVPRADSNAGADPSEYLRVATQLHALGLPEQARAVFEVGIALAEPDPSDPATARVLADLHAGLATMFLKRGELDSAAENYRAALRLVPTLLGCWCNLANVELRSGRPQESISLYLQALELDPGHWPSRVNLVQALKATFQFSIARTLLLELLDEQPQQASLHHELGMVCFELKALDEAIEHFELAFAIDPGLAESLYWIADIKEAQEDRAGAKQAYMRAAQVDPLIRRPAVTSPAKFRVLALFAPLVGNTPTRLMLKDCAYDVDTLVLLPSGRPDLESFKYRSDLVLNLVSEADHAPEMLALAAELASRIGKPVVNDPANILRTTRDATARLLQGIPACRVPQTFRVAAGPIAAAAASRSALAFPLLARPAGTHGGDRFDMIGDAARLLAFLGERPEQEHYLIEYIDYRSADGYFRKYRLIFVGDKIMPYHLAIGETWKLHRDNTDMGSHTWMKREEESFLRDPGSVFDRSAFAALRTIRDRVGLDYFGIDCGLGACGELIVFEVNASMLVHEEPGEFSYKNPFIWAIKAAFDDMLASMVARH
jgi:tetratricopeptide (TPR) repeat protein